MRQKRNYEIDGVRFSTLEEFYDEISNVLIPGTEWGRNLDAFNDILRGGFGTPDEGFTLKWLNSEISKERLGYTETVRQLQNRLKTCHPSNREYVSEELSKVEKQEGSTVFDWLVEIIMDHCPGGEESENGVELLLE
ncbi:MAG: barstar family protein [Deltaproteobacteria bacterium]|nr:barstar family protein [Deltaproteobacteria bacterium]